MTAAIQYDDLVTRNSGYIDAATQASIRDCRLLIAGCGIGSGPAVCAARMGFERFVLVDGDVVDGHNLNRQFYDAADVGQPKVLALRDKILRINPSAQVEVHNVFLDADNTAAIVKTADVVFDTVDFLDLPAILRLHGSARALGIPVFTALSVGFGALVWYFPPTDAPGLADILASDLAALQAAGGGQPSYADVFARFMQRLAPHLDSQVVEQVGKVLSLMKEGKPCPASQVAVGGFAVSAMAMSMIHDMLAGRSVPRAPQLVVHSFASHRTTVADLSTPSVGT